MTNKLIPVNPVIEYPDYKKFINFINDDYEIILKNINPYEFFRLNLIDDTAIGDIEKYLKEFFKGKYNPIPTFKKEHNGLDFYQKFEDFTSRDEVKNISLWGLSCLKNLSSELPSRFGKELEIKQADNPRNGRLDVVALAENELVILEAKTSLFSLLSEGRFKYQVPSYKNECMRIISERNNADRDTLNLNIFLFIGGEETDLYPPTHPDCTTGKVGEISKIFYDELLQREVKFISANALWALAAVADATQKKIYFNKVLPQIFKEKTVLGLLSGGVVIHKNNTFEVMPLTLE